MIHGAASEHKSSSGDDWCTPSTVRDAVWSFFDGEPDLDPCSNPGSIMGGIIQFWGPPATDGLVVPWSGAPSRHKSGRLRTFVNCPYSAKYDWAQKCYDEWLACGHMEIIGLFPADTDCQWFQKFAAAAPMRCWWAGRLTFIGDRDYPARFPSVLVYWGPRPRQFERHFSRYGWCR